MLNAVKNNLKFVFYSPDFLCDDWEHPCVGLLEAPHSPDVWQGSAGDLKPSRIVRRDAHGEIGSASAHVPKQKFKIN